MANEPRITQESLLTDLLRRARLLREEVVASRPAIPQCDAGWTRAEEELEYALYSLGTAVSMAIEHLGDEDAIEAGDKRRLPSGWTDVVPE